MGITAEALTSAVKAEAHKLGFELVGVTTPEPPPHLQTYEQWLEAGRHASMGYLDTESARSRRADPRLILPECQSIIVLGIRYESANSGGTSATGEGVQGRIAAYAWGDDYHLVLPPRLNALVAFIEQQVGHPVPNRCYTDTGPILERELAQRAGLGWIGKNTCLIHPRHGSYFLLAEIFLALPLEPDPPFLTDHCGTCTRCIEACPTGCILPDRTLDAGRCISYLTIENREEIPTDLRPLTGDWVFGCDICQTVCPWNIRFAQAGGDPAFVPSPDMFPSILADELSLNASQFNGKFRKSPIRRAKRRGYLRNVATALGNVGGPPDLPALEMAGQDAEELVGQHAVWAIERIKSREGD